MKRTETEPSFDCTCAPMALLTVRFGCLLLLLSLLGPVQSGRVLRQIQQRVLLTQRHRVKQQLHSVAARRPLLTEGRIAQPLDHLDRQNNRTFSQRYFVNLEFWHRSGGPVFLYIGGEGTLSEYSVLAGHHVSMAAQHSALLVSLEHRYYGQSAASTLDNDQLDTERLSQLSSQQALYDLMLFQQYICMLYGLTSRNTWISFGGSYAGSLSAWLRGKFPHLIYGAVASSAPVKAQLNFTEYNKVVAKSLSNPVVGGSDQCVLAVRQAFSVLDSALRSGRLSSVATDFQSCTALSDPADRRELLSSLAGIAMGAAQYDGQGVPLSIAQVCAIMGNSSSADAYTRLAQLAQAYLQQVGEPCLWSSFQQRLSELQDIRLQPGGVGERQWSYQTCTEFGYYQSCEDPSCPFSPLLTLQAQTQLCPLVFGVSEDRLASAVQFTNSYYGSDSPATYRVLYVNGDVDPWHVLSVLPGSSCCGGRGGGGEGSLALLIPGASHCADMAPPYLTDPPALREARQEIENHVANWLNAAELEAI